MRRISHLPTLSLVTLIVFAACPGGSPQKSLVEPKGAVETTPSASAPSGTQPHTPPPKSPTELKVVKMKQAATMRRDTKGLQTSIQGPSKIKAPEAIKLLFVVKNTTDKPHTFCDYHTPFEGLSSDIFEVKDVHGKILPYQGIMAKRHAPGPQNFWTLPEKSQTQAPFDLGEGYKLSAGHYTIRFKGNEISGLPASATFALEITP